MQEKVQFTGIVVKNLDYQDNAQIAYILTKDELISVIIKGAKKIDSKTRPLSQIITKISGLRTNSSRISTFTEGIIVDNYNDIKEDYLKTQVTMCILEKIYYLYDNFSMNEKVYDFVEQILEKLKQSSYPKSLLLIFEIPVFSSTKILSIKISFSFKLNPLIIAKYCFSNSWFLICSLSLDAHLDVLAKTITPPVILSNR